MVQSGWILNVDPAAHAGEPSLAVDATTPYVTWTESENGKIYVKRFNGS